MQIRIGQCDEAARRRDGEGIVFVVGQRKLTGPRGEGEGKRGWECEKEKETTGDESKRRGRIEGWLRENGGGFGYAALPRPTRETQTGLVRKLSQSRTSRHVVITPYISSGDVN